MLAPIIGFLLAATSPGNDPAARPGPIELGRIATWIRATERQRISLWTNRDEDPYRRGEQARVYFKPEIDGYITVLRVDTDGRTRVLFPREPWEDNFARGGGTFEVLDRDDRAFTIDDYPGVGYIFAVSSPDPFRYDEFVRGDHWDYRLIADGRVRGDPYVSLTEFASRIAGPGEYDYDIIPYYVEEHYDYPRFVCYDCHSYVSYSYWNPYHYSCSRFRIVIYDDYYYYPYRYYRGRNVVFVRPYRPGPRYVFKDHDGRRDYVTRERQRPDGDGRRGVGERDRTSADVGGRGSIPAPVEPRGRRTVNDRPGVESGRDGRSNPDSPRRRTGDDNGAAERPGNPGTSEPRRRSGEDTRPNIVPRDNTNPPERRAQPRREEPQREQPRREEPRREEPRRSEPRREEPRRETTRQSEERAEPRRSEPSRTEPRAEPRSEPRAEPRREPSRAEPRRSSPPPQSRPQPTGDPQLRRRRPS
jgi:Domain of unknown function (DUF4384)